MPTATDLHDAILDAILDALFDALDDAETEEDAQRIVSEYRALMDDDDVLEELVGDGIQESESFFANCSRDEHGHCKTGTGGSGGSDSKSEADAPLTADEKKEAKAAWDDHAKAKEAHAKEVEALEASHAKAMEEHTTKVKEIDAAHAEVVKAHEAKVKDIEASHAKATKEWEARDEARTSRRDATEADHVSDAMDKTGGVKSKPPSHDEAGKREDYEAAAKAHADEHQTQWDAAYGESGHLEKSLDSVGATGKEKDRVASLADRGKQAIGRGGTKYQKAVAKHADAVDALREHREKMPDEPTEPDEPDAPDELSEDATDDEKASHQKAVEQHEKDRAAYEKDKAKYDADQQKYDKASAKLDDLEEKANDLESEAMDAADALETTFTEHQEKLTDAVSKIQERIGGDIDKEEAKDEQPDDPELPYEPDEPEYPDEPELELPDEPDEPDLPHPDTFEKEK